MFCGQSWWPHPGPADMKVLLLQVLYCLGLLRGEAQGSHSLRYSFSFLSEPLPGVPQYSVVGYVDEVPIIGFTSESSRAGPRALWMENVTDEEPQYWEERTVTFQEVETKLSNSLRDLMEQKNQVLDLHVLQMMLGCDLREDGSVKWFERFAYDGSNLTANADPAADTEDRGNTEKSFECKKELKKLLKYGEESLLRRVTPRAMVSQRKANDRAFLMGYAYGFYPRDIEVKWVHDGVEILWESNELLPNPDGTYQVRTAVEVQEGDDVKTYEYHVNHSSLPEIVTVEYDPRRRLRPLWLVLPVLGSVSVLVAAVVIWTRGPLKRFFTPGSSTGSDIRSSTSQGSPEAAKMMSGDP